MPLENRTLIAAGAAVALVAAVGLAVFMGRGDGPSEPPPAAKGGLVVDVADAPALEGQRQLRCYVEGRDVGLATLSDCARRNGVATGGLDVGVDSSGALVAAPTASLSPPPTVPVKVEAPAVTDTPPVAAPAQDVGQSCMRNVSGEWRTVSEGANLNTCVRTLYAGTCVAPGEAQYGMWADTTLRLVPGRVEQSFDNVQFRALTRQDKSCQFPDL